MADQQGAGSSQFEGQQVGCVRIVDGKEAEAFIEAGGGWVFGAEAHAVKIGLGVLEKRGDEEATDPVIPPGCADIDAADAAGRGIGEEWIAIEAADGNQEIAFDDAEEDFARLVEVVFAGRPLFEQSIDEVIALDARFGVEFFQAWYGKLDLLDQSHG
jgi:hypothetical protein